MPNDVNSLVFDPNAMGMKPGSFDGSVRAPAPTVQGMQEQQPKRPIQIADAGGDDAWARIMDAAKRGLISAEQMQKLQQKMGYGMQEPNIANASNGLAGQIGTTAGNLLGGGITAGVNAYKKSQQPGDALTGLQDSSPGNDLSQAMAPPPGWNQ